MANYNFKLCIGEGRLTTVANELCDVSQCFNIGRVYILHMRHPQAGWEKGLVEQVEVHGAGTYLMATPIYKGGWKM